ncbi:hypothetical protein [Desmospora activa]|uniref:DUF5668 domain-containing protein n=1 Tax=Desmospora activa DSM 45169 TaxID=1121389 RepID=A0A2T4Z1X4_9BACL|nr:hypothetical protein [Desmospora activa]PTM54765.1 hypothetical protein C8J48_3417 [Desmospora activa DSM 45169]
MTRKHLGFMMIGMAIIYTVVELLTLKQGAFFNFFIPVALVIGGISLSRGEQRDEKVFKKKNVD